MKTLRLRRTAILTWAIDLKLTLAEESLNKGNLEPVLKALLQWNREMILKICRSMNTTTKMRSWSLRKLVLTPSQGTPSHSYRIKITALRYRRLRASLLLIMSSWVTHLRVSKIKTKGSPTKIWPLIRSLDLSLLIMIENLTRTRLKPLSTSSTSLSSTLLQRILWGDTLW